MTDQEYNRLIELIAYLESIGEYDLAQYYTVSLSNA